MPNWDEIVDQHGPTVFRLAKRILGHGPDADDVVQEVFLEVFRLRAKREIRSWAGFLQDVATHRALDRLRRRQKTQSLNDVDISDAGDGPIWKGQRFVNPARGVFVQVLPTPRKPSWSIFGV